MTASDHAKVSICIEPRLLLRLQTAALLFEKSPGEIVSDAIEEFFANRLTPEQKEMLDFVEDGNSEMAGTA